MKQKRKMLSPAAWILVMILFISAFVPAVSAEKMTTYTPKAYEPKLGTFIAGNDYSVIPETIPLYSSDVLYKQRIEAGELVVGMKIKMESAGTLQLGFNNKQFPIAIQQISTGAIMFMMYNLSETAYYYPYGKTPVQVGPGTTASSQIYYKGDAKLGQEYEYSFVFKKNADGLVKLERAYLDGQQVTFQKTVRYNNTTEDAAFSAADIPFAENVDWAGANVTTGGGAVSLTKSGANTANISIINDYVYIPAAPALSCAKPEITGDIAEGNTLSASAAAANTTEKDEDVYVVLACYENDTKALKSVSVTPHTVTAGTAEKNLTGELLLSGLDSEKTYFAKAFVWKTGMNPLCEPGVPGVQ